MTPIHLNISTCELNPQQHNVLTNLFENFGNGTSVADIADAFTGFDGIREQRVIKAIDAHGIKIFAVGPGHNNPEILANLELINNNELMTNYLCYQ